MKYLKFQYQLSIQLDKDIHHHYFTLKCLPKTENGQNVIQLKTRINADYYSISQDSFSNKMIYGCSVTIDVKQFYTKKGNSSPV